MNLRFAARGEGSSAFLHLVVTDRFRFGDIVRKRGEALCNARLPNLHTLDRQIAEGRLWCSDCIDVMERVRMRRSVELPAASGLVAADLIRDLRGNVKRPGRRGGGAARNS